MASQLFSRSAVARPVASTRTLIASFLSRSVSATSPHFATSTTACAVRRSLLRHLSSAIFIPSSYHDRSSRIRSLSTRATSSSLNDSNPNWSNRPPKETILLDGCDFEHWLVVMEKPEGDPTRDEIIDSYIKTLAMVVGSEEEARMKIYSVSTRCYFAFGALVSEELSYKIKELPRVRWVLPDSYLNVKEKDYGGEPFINGEAVPYDPKYHEEWERNNQRAMERNRRNDRPRNNDRSRSFNRNRNMQYQDVRSTQPSPMANPGMANDSSNIPVPPPTQGGYQNNSAPQNQGGFAQNSPAPPNQGGFAQNRPAPPSQGGFAQNRPAPPSQGGYGQTNSIPPSHGGYNQSTPAPPNQGLYGQNNPVSYNQGGFGQTNSVSHGGFGQSNPVSQNQGGFGQNNPGFPNQGGFGPDNPVSPNQRGFGQNNQVQGGFGQNNPVFPNQRGVSQNNPVSPNQGGFGQNNPVSQGGFGHNMGANQTGYPPQYQGNYQHNMAPNQGSYSQGNTTSSGHGWSNPQNSPNNEGARQNYRDNFSPARD